MWRGMWRGVHCGAEGRGGAGAAADAVKVWRTDRDHSQALRPQRLCMSSLQHSLLNELDCILHPDRAALLCHPE